DRRVIPDVKPGYMRELLPDAAPAEPEDWENIFNDIERVIMPGASSPACTELEMILMDWLCRALGLPVFFLHHHPDSRGGGVLQSSVSESTLVALLAARKDKILQLRAELDQDVDDSVLNARLVAYASVQAHSSVEKAGLISLVKIRFLPTDETLSLRGDTLKQAVQEDRRRGLVPFMLCSTLGTTGVCAFDQLTELGPVCEEEGLWLHVDAAYAGSAYLCPELRWSLQGVEFAHSFVFNPSKWMMVHFDCTAFWVKDKFKLQQTFSVDPVYLRHENSQAATDFMHWQIPLSRRFRSLKLWFVMRSFGLKNLQAHIRHVRNALTQELLRRLTRSGTMYLIPAEIHSKRIIRFTVTSQFTTAEDIRRDWGVISKTASVLLAETQGLNNQPRSGEEELKGEALHSDETSDETEDVVTRLEKAHLDLWIDKSWNRPRRPMRSLSCSSEPLPHTYIGPLFGLREAAGGLPPTTESGSPVTVTQVPSNVPDKQALKKLTKFYSVPSFCNQWVQCGRYQLCCPLKVSQGAQKHNCRRINCMPTSPAANTAGSAASLEAAAAAELL
uniref:Histidine decarboxylase n=1 Tax=Kryptolebias marmoratus TaxID=37003 RepID=A0A3Q3AX27_KRYMA